MINPISCLDAEQVQIRLSGLDVIESMRDLFCALGQDRASQPPQSITLFPKGQGDFITYSGVLADQKVFGLKVSPYLKTDGPPIITAYTLLMSMETGQPLMLCDSMALTKERTAATTALAIDLLAPKNVHRLAVIGSGPIALAHLKYVHALRDWESIRISSLNLPQNSEVIKPRLAELNANITITRDQQQAIEDADVIMLCASSATPVIDVTSLAKHALITSISTNAPRAHEIAPSALSQMDVYCV
jgi:L-arginine dehydrogenase